MNLLFPSRTTLRRTLEGAIAIALAVSPAACKRESPPPPPSPPADVAPATPPTPAKPDSAATAPASATPKPQPAAAGSAAIKLSFPEAFVRRGTFAGVLPNLEAPDGPPLADTFQAPQGTQLVSEGKPVTTSTRPLQGRAAMLTDGDNSSYPDALLTLPGRQWAQIDLGAVMTLQKIHVWHAQNLGPDAYLDLVVQAAEDPAFEKNVTTLYNADADGSLGLGEGSDKAYVETHQGRLIDGKGAKARYVRVWGSGSYRDKRLRFAEVRVYAVP